MTARVIAMQSRVARLLANLLLIAFVCYLAVVSGQLVWLLVWQEPELSRPVIGESVGPRSSAAATSVAGYDLFGRTDKPAPVAKSVKRSAPETGLRLTLEGVLVGARPEESGAIVAQSGGETAYYRVGDRLPGNAELAEVEAHRILLRRSGQYESLSFEQSDDEGLVAEAEDPFSLSSPEQLLADTKEQLDRAGAAALSRFGLRPAEEGGASGYVYDGSNAMLNAVNLRAGDIITAINGQRLGDLEQDKALLENWRSQPQLDIELQRNGSVFTVSYAIPEQWR